MSPSAPHSGHPEGLPHLFLDRSLGRIQVPGLLRAGGLDLTTLAEHYGIPADESVADQEWLYMGTTKCQRSKCWRSSMRRARA